MTEISFLGYNLNAEVEKISKNIRETENDESKGQSIWVCLIRHDTQG